MKRITILGSTGSIGTQALSIIEKNPQLFQIEALTCGKNVELFRRQLEKFKPHFAVTADEAAARELQKEFPEISFSYGISGIIEAASKTDCDMVLNSLLGMMGLEPTYQAIMAGKDIAFANKETLVAGGEIIMAAVAEKGVQMLPVDSEHSAIFQCLQGNQQNPVHKILLTASGGPFRGYTRAQLAEVSLEQALKHPKWVMGSKITIDSATLMNKGLEVIEASWLFHVPAEKIQTVVHPQSIIHSMVEFEDGAVMAQLGTTDMCGPIGYAFAYPKRLPQAMKCVNFFELGNLTFEEPDLKTFRCLDYAYQCLKAGGSYPVVLNAANEVLVQAFLEKKIKFVEIQDRLGAVLEAHHPVSHLSLEEVLAVDRQTRESIFK